MNIRLTQIDGALPNLALMKLSHWHKSIGDNVFFTRHIDRQPEEPQHDIVYGSSIFKFSSERISRFKQQWPVSIVGGTGSNNSITIEQIIGSQHEHYDYSGYPNVDFSIGFTQRGCRLKCKFCVVPEKEGKPKSVNTILDIWRGPPYPKKLHILDNDFFGNSEWRERIDEIREGKFKVCLSQGINVRLIDRESAKALSTIQYRDTKFQKRRLYSAWDNLGDEKIFFKGVDLLEKAGIPPKHLMVYMLVGYDKNETWDRIWYRFYEMIGRGVSPYPMVFDRSRKDLCAFQRWVVMGLYRIVLWINFDNKNKSEESIEAWLRAAKKIVSKKPSPS